MELVPDRFLLPAPVMRGVIWFAVALCAEAVGTRTRPLGVLRPLRSACRMAGGDAPHGLTEASPLAEMRAFVKAHGLDISTSGKGRTKATIYADIVAASPEIASPTPASAPPLAAKTAKKATKATKPAPAAPPPPHAAPPAPPPREKAAAEPATTGEVAAAQQVAAAEREAAAEAERQEMAAAEAERQEMAHAARRAEEALRADAAARAAAFAAEEAEALAVAVREAQSGQTEAEGRLSSRLERMQQAIDALQH